MRRLPRRSGADPLAAQPLRRLLHLPAVYSGGFAPVLSFVRCEKSDGRVSQTLEQEIITQMWRRAQALTKTTALLWLLVVVIVVAWLGLLLIGATIG
jgi:hypothetical protein